MIIQRAAAVRSGKWRALSFLLALTAGGLACADDSTQTQATPSGEASLPDGELVFDLESIAELDYEAGENDVVRLALGTAGGSLGGEVTSTVLGPCGSARAKGLDVADGRLNYAAIESSFSAEECDEADTAVGEAVLDVLASDPRFGFEAGVLTLSGPDATLTLRQVA